MAYDSIITVNADTELLDGQSECACCASTSGSVLDIALVNSWSSESLYSPF